MTDRVIVYQGSIPQDTDILQSQRNTMVALGSLIGATIGFLAVDGFTPTPTGTPSLTVNFGPGTIFSQQTLDATAFGSLGSDTADLIWKSGINVGSTAFTFVAPTTAGQSINYLIQCAFVESDANPVVLGYYNAANPIQALNGPAGGGAANNTSRIQRATLSVKAGAAAATGTQATPVADSGNTGLFVITVAYGQTQITSANLANAQLASAPFLKYKLGNLAQFVQSGTLNYAIDTGTPNVVVASVTPTPQAIVPGTYASIKITNQNTGPSTLNLNGFGAKPITSFNGSPIVAGNLVAGMIAEFVWDGNNWQLTNSYGRVKLNADLTLYVSNSGSDTLNTGLSVGSSFASIQKAVNVIAHDFDFNGHTATVNIANGTYGPVAIYGQPVGHNLSPVIFRGNTASPGSVLVVGSGTTQQNAWIINLSAWCALEGIQFGASGVSSAYLGLGYGLIVATGCYCQIHSCAFGSCSTAQLSAMNGGVVTADFSPVTFTGTSFYGLNASAGGLVWLANSPLTFNSATYTGAYAVASQCGSITFSGNVITGTVVGPKYGVSFNGNIVLNGITCPGSTAGSVAFGGVVA